MDFKKYIADIKDFPEEGIIFRDVTPLLKDKEAYKETMKYYIGAVYIVGNEKSKDVIKYFDFFLNNSFTNNKVDKLRFIYNKYFRKDIIFRDIILSTLSIVTILGIIYMIIYPFIKKIIIFVF